ncbi:MAG: glycosyltransferase [Vicinamibacterales bacterium]
MFRRPGARQFLDAARVIPDTISAIVPTIGRADALAALLEALASQTRRPDEVIIADGSDGTEVRAVAANGQWRRRGLPVRYLHVHPPNAVRQRQAAIEAATGSLLLLLDDDVVPESNCVAALADCLRSHMAVGVSADFSNQQWPPPTTLWRWYLRWVHRITGSMWQGRVIGPLLRFGYHPMPVDPSPMEWLGSGNSLVRRDAYDRAGGFSDFFLHRSTLNEDVDLGLKLGRQGRLLLCPAARMAHTHAPGGRASVRVLAEDDLYNRYVILRRTMRHSRFRALTQITIYFVVETLSGLAASARHLRSTGFGDRLVGRVRALMRIAGAAPGIKTL